MWVARTGGGFSPAPSLPLSPPLLIILSASPSPALPLHKRNTWAAVWFASMKFVHMPCVQAQVGYAHNWPYKVEVGRTTIGNISIIFIESKDATHATNSLRVSMHTLLKCSINGKVTTVFPSDAPAALLVSLLSPCSTCARFYFNTIWLEKYANTLLAKQRRLPSARAGNIN